MQRRSKPVHHGMEEVVPLRSREESDYSRSKRRRNPSWRHPRSYLVLFLIISTAAFWYTQLTTPERRTIFRENSNYRWKRLVWRWKAPQPVGTLTASLSTRRQVLQLESTGSSNSEREMHLVERHLQLLDQDMNVSVSESTNTNNKTVVLVWSGSYPFWFANVKMGADTSCNIPCEWTTDRTYDRSKVSGLVCLLYQMEKGQCRDINPHLWKNRPILGVSWENDWKGSETVPRLDELPASQLWKLKRQSPYNLISSHELDSHIPVLYSDLADFIDEFKVQSLNQLVQERQDKKASVMFTISNCQAPLRPDRLEIMDSLSSYFPTSSYGKCLGEEEHMRLPWNSRDNYQSSKFVQEMSKYLFIYAPENSYGIDYVTEKVYGPLRSGAVPIYIGAPNIAAFLPDRDAVIHVSDFDSIEELGEYLQTLASNQTLLVERHHSWRTRPLPDRLLKLAQLVDRKSKYSYMCKVCNCFQGKIGCPTFT